MLESPGLNPDRFLKLLVFNPLSTTGPAISRPFILMIINIILEKVYLH